MNNRTPAGFSLLEMSIVLVIIGVITGGILLGKSMLMTSRLQTVMTDANNYITAVGNFKQQYQALPGDFSNATSLWGTDSVNCPSGGGATGTCNGNGDGMISGTGGTTYEIFRLWQHLYLAGLINQKMSGVTGPLNSYQAIAGTNVPIASVEGGSWGIEWLGGGATTNNVNAYYFPGFLGNTLLLGAAGASGGGSGILTADQAASIDTKMDDGMPATGKVRSTEASYAAAPNCTTSNAVTATYNVGVSGQLCVLLFPTGY